LRVETRKFQKERERQQEQLANAKRLREGAEAGALSEARVAEAARKSAKRTKWFSSALAVLLLGSLGLAWYAQRQQAIAESRQLAAQARQNLDRDPASSLALAIRAVRRFRTEQAEVELNAALSLPQLHVILHHDVPVFTAAFSPDSKRVVTVSADKTARVWDAESGRVLATLTGHQGTVYTAAFSPDGKRVRAAATRGSPLERRLKG
jgi:hypothetical protein